MHEWLQENGYQDDDGVGQLNYLIHENVWYSRDEASQYATLTDFLASSSTDLAELTHAFNVGWEGIHDHTWDFRVTYAEKCYDFITKHANDTSINKWFSKNEFLSVDERLNNAVLIYRFLSAGGGGGGTHTTKKKSMPVWMMLKYHY